MFNILYDSSTGPKFIFPDDVPFEKAEQYLQDAAKAAKERDMAIVRNPRIVGTAELTFTEKKIGRVNTHGRWF